MNLKMIRLIEYTRGTYPQQKIQVMYDTLSITVLLDLLPIIT